MYVLCEPIEPQMTTPRLMVETPCAHGNEGCCDELGGYREVKRGFYHGAHCPGGSREEASVEQVIAWLREQGAVNYEAALTKFKTFWDRPFASPEADLETCKAMIDAALSPTSQEGE